MKLSKSTKLAYKVFSIVNQPTYDTHKPSVKRWVNRNNVTPAMRYLNKSLAYGLDMSIYRPSSFKAMDSMDIDNFRSCINDHFNFGLDNLRDKRYENMYNSDYSEWCLEKMHDIKVMRIRVNILILTYYRKHHGDKL